MKDSYPRWEGLYNNSLKLNQSFVFVDKVTSLDESDIEKINFPENIKEEYEKSLNDIINKLKAYGYSLKVKETGEKFFNMDEPSDTSTIIGKFIYQLKKRIEQIKGYYDIMDDSIINIKAYGEEYNEEIKSTIKEFNNISEDLKSYQNGYLNEVEYYIKIAKACGYILSMIYFCLLGVVSFLGCVLLLAYTYLQNQKNLDLLMHITWNCIRFFVFSFFLYGAAFGMLSKGLRDIIAYNKYVFGQNLNKNSTTLLLSNKESKSFFWQCLNEENTNFKGNLDDIISEDLKRFVDNFGEVNVLLNDEFYLKKYIIEYTIVPDYSLRNIEETTDSINENTEDFDEIIYGNMTSDGVEIPISEEIVRLENFINVIKERLNRLIELLNIKKNSRLRNIEDNFDISIESLDLSFDCGFLKNDLNLLYNSLYDLSVESRILCVISCFIGFFGEILTYFYLLSMYHYDNNEFTEGKLNDVNGKRKRKINISNNNNLNIDNSSKNEFLDKSKPIDMKKYNHKLDIDFSSK